MARGDGRRQGEGRVAGPSNHQGEDHGRDQHRHRGGDRGGDPSSCRAAHRGADRLRRQDAGHADDQRRDATSDHRLARHEPGVPRSDSPGGAGHRRDRLTISRPNGVRYRSGCNPRRCQHHHGSMRVDRPASRTDSMHRYPNDHHPNEHHPNDHDLRRQRPRACWDVRRRRNCGQRPHRCRHESCARKSWYWGDGRSA